MSSIKDYKCKSVTLKINHLVRLWELSITSNCRNTHVARLTSLRMVENSRCCIACKNLWIKYIQQSESAMKYQIYFIVEFQELLQIFLETYGTSIHLLSNSSLSQQRGFLHETGFSRTTLLSTVKYSSEYSLFMPYSTISFWIDWVRVYKYTKINGLDAKEITSLPKDQNLMNIAGHFIHRRTQPACLAQDQDSLQSIEFVDRPVLEKLDIFRIFKICPGLSSQNMYRDLENVCMSSVTSRFLSPVSVVSARND